VPEILFRTLLACDGADDDLSLWKTPRLTGEQESTIRQLKNRNTAALALISAIFWSPKREQRR